MSFRSSFQKNRGYESDVQNRIQSFLDEYYFDVQSIPIAKSSSLIDEAALARILTKLAVGSATVWWSLLEIKEIVSLYRRSKKNRSA